MTKYTYKARQEDGKIVTAFMDATGKEEAIDRICKFGYYPISVEEVKLGQVKKNVKVGVLDGIYLYKDITTFTSQLSDLIKNGMPILSAISVIEEQTQNKKLRTIVAEIFLRIKDGAKFSDVLRTYSSCFDRFYVSMVRVGEDNGTLAEVLAKIEENRKKQAAIKRKLRSALVYPLLIIIVGVFSVMFMMTHVLPKLVDLIASMNVSLPVPTQILIKIIDFFEKNGTQIIIGAIIVLLMITRIMKIPKNRVWFDKVKVKFPLFGQVLLKEELARFLGTFSVSLNNGLQLINALDLSTETIENEFVKKEIEGFSKHIRNGESLGNVMKKSKIIPIMLSNMVSVSEQSGSLPETLNNISQDYEMEMDEIVKSLMVL
ncbi:MAG: type II secretion system F family protein, partial [Candidatus Omnitrophica bacterium]|nr:type II secretion system F family protein [Candidatus Omnitrophota bacterium]